MRGRSITVFNELLQNSLSRRGDAITTRHLPCPCQGRVSCVLFEPAERKEFAVEPAEGTRFLLLELHDPILPRLPISAGQIGIVTEELAK